MQLALLCALAAPACFLAPTTAVQHAASTAPAQTARPQPDPFPMPREGLKLPATTAENAFTLAELTNEFSRVTGETLVIDPQVRQTLQSTAVGLNRALDVPPAEVYFVVETLLVQNGFVFTRLNDREPRMLALWSGSEKRMPRTNSVHVPIDSLEMWARHPAFVITTAIDLPNTDVRTLSNSMRTMFVDGSTQQIVPVGSSNTLVITSYGSEVVSLVRMLREIDSAAARENERRMKAAAEKPTPKPEVPAEKSKD